MPRQDIYKDAKGFDKHPENINRTGQNRKSFSSFNLRCKERGIEQVTKKVFFETISYLMNLTNEEMKDTLIDKDNPQWLRWLIQDLGDKTLRSKIMADYRDWTFGKAEQKSEIALGGEKLNIIISRADGNKGE